MLFSPWKSWVYFVAFEDEIEQLLYRSLPLSKLHQYVVLKVAAVISWQHYTVVVFEESFSFSINVHGDLDLNKLH